MLCFGNKHSDQHLQIIGSSLIGEEHANRRVHLSREPASQVSHDDARDDQGIKVNALLRREDLPNGNHDLSPRVRCVGIRPWPGLLERHMLEHISHRNEVGAKRNCPETSGADSARDVVPSDDFESPSRGSHHLGTIQGDAVIEPLDGGEGSAVFGVRADGGSAGETAGPQGADGLLAASRVGRHGTVVFFCGEQGLAVHWTRRSGRLLEPSGYALPAEDMVARL